MSNSSSEVEVEVRWLLRAPAVPAPELLERWQAAVEASQSRFPLARLTVELQSDQSCLRCSLHSDGWEEWDNEATRSGHHAAERSPAPLVLAFLLACVRYRGVPKVEWYPLTPSQEDDLHDRPLRLRVLSAQSGCLVALPRQRASELQASSDAFSIDEASGGHWYVESDDDERGENSRPHRAAAAQAPQLLLCGPRPAVKRVKALLQEWEVARVCG